MCFICTHKHTHDAPHLQRIRLSEVRRPSDLHGEPHVNHLSGDVAERQVADYGLLSLSGICQTHVTAR